MNEGPTLIADVLVPVGVLLTVVTTVGTVQWLKGKRRIALLAPLAVVSVIGIIGITRVAKPGSPWARWRYGPDRMGQARARFGGSAADLPDLPDRLDPPATLGAGLVLAGVVAGAPLGAVTSLVGGVLAGHALLASAGRPASGRICVVLAVAAALGEGVAATLDPGDWRIWPAAATTVTVAAGAAILQQRARRGS